MYTFVVLDMDAGATALRTVLHIMQYSTTFKLVVL